MTVPELARKWSVLSQACAVIYSAEQMDRPPMSRHMGMGSHKLRQSLEIGFFDARKTNDL